MLLTDATLVNWWPGTVVPNQAILIADDQITAIGKSETLIERHPSEARHDVGGKLVLPGNVCAHTHLYSAFARGISIPGQPPPDFPAVLRTLWWPLDRALSYKSVRLSALVGLLDAIKHGTTTLFDHHSSPNAIVGSLDVIADAVEQAGLRAVLCYEVSDRDGPAATEAAIEENSRFVRASRKLIKGTFGLHANLTLSNETLAVCAEAVADLGCGCHIHVAEHESDEEASINQSGKRAVARLADFGLLTDRTIAAHAIHVDSAEIELLRDSGAWVTHQARSNMNNGVGVQAFDYLQREGVKVAIGTDGIDQSMFAEWQAAYFLHKAAARDPRAVPPRAVLAAAEVNVRMAETYLGVQLGRLEPGAAADLIVLDYEPYTPLTAETLLGHAFFGFPGSIVTGTIVAGQILMWDRSLRTLDEAAIVAEARAHAPEVWERYAANVPQDEQSGRR